MIVALSRFTAETFVLSLQFSLRKKQALEDYAPLDEGQEAHWEVVERILFLYAKLNPGTVITPMVLKQADGLYVIRDFRAIFFRVYTVS